MSDYCSMTFVATKANKDNIQKEVNKLFDAIIIKYVSPYNETMNTYSLSIAELTLKESIDILDALKRKFKNLYFVIDYGIY